MALRQGDDLLANDALVLSYLTDDLTAARCASSTCCLWASLQDEYFWQSALEAALFRCPATLQQRLRGLWSQWRFVAALSPGNYDLITARVHAALPCPSLYGSDFSNVQILTTAAELQTRVIEYAPSRQLSAKLFLEAWASAFNSDYANELRCRGIGAQITDEELLRVVEDYSKRHSWWVASKSLSPGCCNLAAWSTET